MTSESLKMGIEAKTRGLQWKNRPNPSEKQELRPGQGGMGKKRKGKLNRMSPETTIGSLLTTSKIGERRLGDRQQ